MANIDVTGSMLIREKAVAPDKPCPIDLGPFDFRDDFEGTGGLASRAAGPGPGTWDAAATGALINGTLTWGADVMDGYPSGALRGGYITIPTDITSITIGFRVGFALPNKTFREFLEFNLGAVTSPAFYNDTLYVDQAATERVAPEPFDWYASIGKEVILTLKKYNNFSVGDREGSIKVCGNPVVGNRVWNGTGFVADAQSAPSAVTQDPSDPYYHALVLHFLNTTRLYTRIAPGVNLDYVWARWH